MKPITTLLAVLLVAHSAYAVEYHVAVNGDDVNSGSQSTPFQTIQHAANLARPGDTITVHEGVYRERINPPRGGTSDTQRITYQAAPGKKVMIKGSEVVTGWETVKNDTWKVVLPNSFFGDHNPYSDLIHGDWFNPMGQKHHTGAVYLNEHWLREAAKLEDVLLPVGGAGQRKKSGYLLNVAWLSPANGKVNAATDFSDKNGTQNADCSEGGQCIGFIGHGHWLKYEGVKFKKNTTELELRVASASEGGVIEIRKDGPEGELLGSCEVANTGGWQSWKTRKATIKPLSGRQALCLVFKGPLIKDTSPLWFGRVDDQNTTLWAQFKGVDPNQELVEITARPTVFYPDKPFVSFITVRGFHLWHAGPQWAPPTAEQVGLIGTHWSKGWVIENNDIRYSICTGVTLGKHGDEFDNTSANSAEGYVKTIERAIAMKWNKETIGHHVVRNNTIAFCEEAGMVGSMGATFSTITGNTIYDINMRKLFDGAEQAGIKFHAAIDTVISDNHIYRTKRGIWLDWMTQGTRVSRNLLHDNPGEDLFVEVNHGPFLADNNIMLSGTAILSQSQGGAYAHNLIAGNVQLRREDSRLTPYHKAHSTEIVDLHDNPRGDDRYYNNLFAKCHGMNDYDDATLPMWMGGNVLLGRTRLTKHENDPIRDTKFDPAFKLIEKADGIYLEGKFDRAWAKKQRRKLITSELLGRAQIPDLPYENRDGSPIRITADYFGRSRNEDNPFPGPFEISEDGTQTLKVWPVDAR